MTQFVHNNKNLEDIPSSPLSEHYYCHDEIMKTISVNMPRDGVVEMSQFVITSSNCIISLKLPFREN